MSKNKRAHKDSREVKVEASKLVKSLSIKGENKEHTRRIINGVQRAIEAYMRQQSAKARELDKKVKKINKVQIGLEQEREGDLSGATADISHAQSKLPWVLFGIASCACAAVSIALLLQFNCTVPVG